MNVQSFIIIKWQEIKFSVIQIFKFFVSDHLNNENPILFKTESQYIIVCEHPAHQVNVSRKGDLCAPDFDNFFETPCICPHRKRL